MPAIHYPSIYSLTQSLTQSLISRHINTYTQMWKDPFVAPYEWILWRFFVSEYISHQFFVPAGAHNQLLPRQKVLSEGVCFLLSSPHGPSRFPEPFQDFICNTLKLILVKLWPASKHTTLFVHGIHCWYFIAGLVLAASVLRSASTFTTTTIKTTTSVLRPPPPLPRSPHELIYEGGAVYEIVQESHSGPYVRTDVCRTCVWIHGQCTYVGRKKGGGRQLSRTTRPHWTSRKCQYLNSI